MLKNSTIEQIFLIIFTLVFEDFNVNRSYLIKDIYKNLIILLISSILVWVIIATDPFSIISSLILLSALCLVITFWYKNSSAELELENSEHEKRCRYLHVVNSNNILRSFNDAGSVCLYQ